MTGAAGQGRRIVLLGAGHAHLHTLKNARSFTSRGHDLVVVAPDRFWYSGLATGMLGGLYPPSLDQIDVGALVGAGGGRHIDDRAVGIDTAARQVRLQSGGTLAYDVLSINLGSLPPPIPTDRGDGVYSVKPIHSLRDLRSDLDARFAGRRCPVRVAIAGGGVTACELAANIVALAARHGSRADVTILAAGEVLKQLPRSAAAAASAMLRRRGVRFRTGGRVVRIDDGRALLGDGAAIPFDLFVNAAGLQPHPLLRDCGLPVDDAGALRVDARLRSIADPAIHGGGDCIAFCGRPLPRIGVYAIRQAPVLCRNLRAAAGDGRPVRFTPQRRYLWIMNLGDGTGLAVRDRLWWRGRAAFWLKDHLDRRFLRSYRPAA